MTVEKMRSALAEVYSGPRWTIRVTTMPENQVIAMYKSMKSEGRLVKHKSIKKKEPGIKKAVQTTIFDPGYSPNGTAT